MKGKVFFSIVVLFFVATIGGSFYMIEYALAPNPDRADVEGRIDRLRSQHPEIAGWLDSLRGNGLLCDTFIMMPTRERHHAFYVRHPQAAGRTALLLHGWRDCSIGMLHIGYIYHQLMHCNILLPDLHGHGQSDGDMIQMGWKDRLDVLHWVDVAERLFRDSVRPSSMVLHGISMGAATVMCVSGENTPDFVKCYVEDCGYTSVWDEFRYEMKEEFGLPPFPLLYAASALCKWRNGWSFGEADAVAGVSRCRKPMLFIHGDSDTFVPSWMVHPCYEAKPDPKEIWITEGCEHNRSYADYRPIYINKVETFVGKYL